MARKNEFQWAKQEGDATPFAERRDGKADKAQRQYLEVLALRLASMTSGQRALLPLDEETQEQIRIYMRQGPKSSRRRQLLRVAAFLREMDLEALEEALVDQPQGGADSPKSWAKRLMEGDDGVLHGFLSAHPRGDRQQLRALIRKARSAGQVVTLALQSGPAEPAQIATAKRAVAKLSRALGETLH